MKKIIYTLLLVAWLSPVLASAEVPAVPAAHPRLYLDASDVNELKVKVTQPEFAAKWSSIQSYFSTKHPVPAALVYLVDGNVLKGRWAIDQCLADIQSSNDYSRWYHTIHYSAIVYDWCYPLLTANEKQIFVDNFRRILALSRSGYPASMSTNSVSAGTTEGEVLTGHLPVGIAIYNEDPTMYNAAAELFMEKFVLVRDIVFDSHSYHQGDSYINRYVYDMFAAWMFRRMADIDVYDGDAQYVPYSIIYNRRPDGRQIRRSDTFDLTGLYGDKRLILMLTGTYYSDPYLLGLSDQWNSYFDGFLESLQMIFRPAGISTQSIDTLPLTKFYNYPMGEMTARTGWDTSVISDDSLFYMRIGGIYFHGHQHRDMGTFQIYHKGPLATTSGVYQSTDTAAGSDHWKDYYHQTISHNGLLIFDPDEEMVDPTYRSVNDGGQRMPNSGYYPSPENLNNYELAEGLKHAVGPDQKVPLYSYISGDITEAYTDKVSKVKRSMVALKLGGQDFPAAMIVFDKVVSSDPSFKKTWLLHSHYEPQINGDQYTVTNTAGDYDGKLVARCLLPASADITKIGGSGYEFWIESVARNFDVTPYEDDEPAAWRVEISPLAQSNEDFFLNVMAVMDSSVTAVPPVMLVNDIDGAAAGAAIEDTVVMFAKDDGPLEEIDFYLPGSSPVKLLLTDLREGLWLVSQNTLPVSYEQVEPDSGVIYIELDPADGPVNAKLVPSLVSHYEFQGGLFNSIEDGGDASSRNGAASTCPDAAQAAFPTNSCFCDLGGSKWLHVGYPSAWSKPALSGQMSLTMWVNTSDASYAQLIGRRYEWRMIIQSGKPVFSLSNSTGSFALTGNTGICDGQWHHIVATYNFASGYVAMYIDGVLDNSLTQSSPVSIESSLRGAIGAIADSYSSGAIIYNGLIDDIRIYNEVLSEYQIGDIFDETQSRFCSDRPGQDLSGDCQITIDDFGILAESWLAVPSLSDLSSLTDQWLDCGLLDPSDCNF
ncbi:MAG: LamG-like jellyroll fold domain-containing protein [Sedimentisphaeraceae bacterium JB056]